MWHRCTTEEEVKDLFKKLAFRLHPDHGGTEELMILLNESYETAKYFYDALNKEKEKPKFTEENPGKYQKSFSDLTLGDERLQVINEILDYARTRKSFNTDFVISIVDYANENGFVTSAQYNSLLKTYYAFKMNERKPENSCEK